MGRTCVTPALLTSTSSPPHSFGRPSTVAFDVGGVGDRALEDAAAWCPPPRAAPARLFGVAVVVSVGERDLRAVPRERAHDRAAEAARVRR